MANTKSSSAVFIRAVIMLTFLAAIPLVALSGSSLPDLIRKTMEKYLPSFTRNQAEKTASVLNEAPPFTGGNASNGDHPNFYANDKGTSPFRSSARENSTISSPGPSQTIPLPSRLANTEVVPANYQSPGETTALPADFSTPVNENHFLQIQNRLKTLGATYYLLETWGNDQRMYRFYCEMTVAGSPNYSRCFETTDSNPIEAMRCVLEQVEKWIAKTK